MFIWLLAILSGILSFLIHPTVFGGFRLPDLGFLAWIFLVPLVVAVNQSKKPTKKKIFWLAFLMTAVGHYGLLYWLITAMQAFGGMPFVGAFGVLSAQVIVFGSIFAVFFTLALWVYHKVRLPLFVLLPVFLTLRDLLIHYFPFGGYPWGIPPYSQGQWLSLFQWLNFTGTFGLSLFIYLINGLIADSVLAFLNTRQCHRAVWIPMMSVVTLLLVSWGVSSLSLHHYESHKQTGKTIKLALIQANIAQDIKWNPRLAQHILENHVLLTDQATQEGADLVLWPETSYPYGFREQELSTLKFLKRDSFEAPLLIGGGILNKTLLEQKLYNGALYIGTDAKIRQAYKKMHLVPFGEYIPFREYLSFMEVLSTGVGLFTPGDEYVLFDILGTKWAPMICIEDIFLRYAREFSKRGADVLLNFTNDAWYGDSSMQYQHVVYDQLRALENRRPLLRITNTGITAVIDATGKVIASIPPFTRDILWHDLKVETGPSFYTRHGDSWLYVLIFAAAGFLGYALLK